MNFYEEIAEELTWDVKNPLKVIGNIINENRRWHKT